MNRPAPSLAILAIAAVILALVFFGRQYLWPAPSRAAALGRAAVAGYGRPATAKTASEDDAATVGGMIDAGKLWAKAHRPNSAAACPTLPIPFHTGCVNAVTTGE